MKNLLTVKVKENFIQRKKIKEGARSRTLKNGRIVQIVAKKTISPIHSKFWGHIYTTCLKLEIFVIYLKAFRLTMSNRSYRTRYNVKTLLCG